MLQWPIFLLGCITLGLLATPPPLLLADQTVLTVTRHLPHFVMMETLASTNVQLGGMPWRVCLGYGVWGLVMCCTSVDVCIQTVVTVQVLIIDEDIASSRHGVQSSVNSRVSSVQTCVRTAAHLRPRDFTLVVTHTHDYTTTCNLECMRCGTPAGSCAASSSRGCLWAVRVVSCVTCASSKCTVISYRKNHQDWSSFTKVVSDRRHLPPHIHVPCLFECGVRFTRSSLHLCSPVVTSLRRPSVNSAQVRRWTFSRANSHSAQKMTNNSVAHTLMTTWPTVL